MQLINFVKILVVKFPNEYNSELDETDGISHSTNILGKGMNPIILPPAMVK